MSFVMLSWLRTPFSMACSNRARSTGPASGVTTTQSSDIHIAILATSLDTMARLKLSSTPVSSSKIASGMAHLHCGTTAPRVLCGQRCREAPLHPVGTHVLHWRGDEPAEAERIQDEA